MKEISLLLKGNNLYSIFLKLKFIYKDLLFLNDIIFIFILLYKDIEQELKFQILQISHIFQK